MKTRFVSRRIFDYLLGGERCGRSPDKTENGFDAPPCRTKRFILRDRAAEMILPRRYIEKYPCPSG